MILEQVRAEMEVLKVELIDEMGSIKDIMGSMEVKMGSIEDRMGSMEVKMGSIEDRMGSTEDEIRKIQGEIADVREDTVRPSIVQRR